MVHVGELVKIDVESLNYSARAVGRVDSFVVFAHGGVPEDRLLVKVTEVKKNYALAETVEVLSASPQRCRPPCIHFVGGCGGCQWQHIAYEHQVHWKKEIVKQALRRIGKIESIPEIEIRGIYPSLRYRNKLRLFPAEANDGGMLFGMHRSGSHEVVPIRECLIGSPI